MVDRAISISNCTYHEVNPVRSLAFFASALAAALLSSRGHITLVTDPLLYFYFFISAALGYITGDLLYFSAIRTIGVSLAVPVANAYPVFVTMTSWLMLGEAASPRVITGVAVVVAGVLVMRLGADDIKGDDHMDRLITPGKSRILRGFLLAVSAGLAWAFSAPFVKLAVLRSGLNPVEFTFYRAATLLAAAWGWRFITVRVIRMRVMPIRDIPRAAWFYFFGSAIIGLCIGSIIYVTSIGVMPLSAVTAITSTSPLMASLFGHFVTKERLRFMQWCGVVMIIVGSVIVSL